MRQFLYALIVLFCPLPGQARLFPKADFSGMYLQWGYNRDWFTRSDLHFTNGSVYDFTVHQARATDQPDFSGFRTSPVDITIPQNSFRIGFYLNPQYTWAVELNFDHAKYVVYDNQKLRVTGQVFGEPIDEDTIIRRQFVHFEHTNGANFYNINYVHQHWLLEGKKYPKLSYLCKAGAGVVIPRSDITLLGRRLDNEFHVAGYIFNAEAGVRFYPLRNLFLEVNIKGGFANYLNVLTVEGGKAHHHFWFGEVIGLVGYDVNTHKRNWRKKPVPVI